MKYCSYCSLRPFLTVCKSLLRMRPKGPSVIIIFEKISLAPCCSPINFTNYVLPFPFWTSHALNLVTLSLAWWLRALLVLVAQRAALRQRYAPHCPHHGPIGYIVHGPPLWLVCNTSRHACALCCYRVHRPRGEKWSSCGHFDIFEIEKMVGKVLFVRII